MTSHLDEKRECKLFPSLLRDLAQGPSAFALLNSSAQIDIESMAWSIVPETVKGPVISIGARLIKGANENLNAAFEGWNIQFKLIRHNESAMNRLSKNQAVMLAALIVMMLIAATFDYRLQISTEGVVFERSIDQSRSKPSKLSPDRRSDIRD